MHDRSSRPHFSARNMPLRYYHFDATGLAQHHLASLVGRKLVGDPVKVLAARLGSHDLTAHDSSHIGLIATDCLGIDYAPDESTIVGFLLTEVPHAPTTMRATVIMHQEAPTSPFRRHAGSDHAAFIGKAVDWARELGKTSLELKVRGADQVELFTALNCERMEYEVLSSEDNDGFLLRVGLVNE